MTAGHNAFRGSGPGQKPSFDYAMPRVFLIAGSTGPAITCCSPSQPSHRAGCSALARRVGTVPSHDHSIELRNLPLEAEQLIAKRGKARTANLRHPFVAQIGNNMQQLGDSFTPDRRDNAELGKVSPDRVYHRGLLADEQMACAVKHQAALLLRRSAPEIVGNRIW
jgi:hypothetical protein